MKRESSLKPKESIKGNEVAGDKKTGQPEPKKDTSSLSSVKVPFITVFKDIF